MAYLAKNSQVVSVKDIAQKEKISFDYLSKILLRLKKAKLVGVKRGTAGGYFLKVKPNKISIGQIIKVLDGNESVAPCLGLGKKYFCPHHGQCSTKNIWEKIQKAWELTLNSLTLADSL